ncbi:MAG: helix-turn-helix transcriptional regulator [Acidobacteriota bacterium]
MRYASGVTIEDEVRQAAKLLESLIQAAGVPESDLERRLGVSPGYVGRVLSGEIELKLRHILSLLRALEIEPSLFFESLYPAQPPRGTIRMEDLQERLQELGLDRPPETPPVVVDDLERLVQGAVRAALRRKGGG